MQFVEGQGIHIKHERERNGSGKEEEDDNAKKTVKDRALEEEAVALEVCTGLGGHGGQLDGTRGDRCGEVCRRDKGGRREGTLYILAINLINVKLKLYSQQVFYN